jgi:DNA-binding response OmpR family regulator
MLSALTPDKDREVGPDRVHNGYLIKPVDVRQLFETIHTLLNVDWAYEARGRTTVKSPDIAMGRPIAAADLAELTRLCQIGHLRGLQDKLRSIELSSPEHRDTVAQLRTMVDSLDLERCARVLEAMCD